MERTEIRIPFKTTYINCPPSAATTKDAARPSTEPPHCVVSVYVLETEGVCSLWARHMICVSITEYLSVGEILSWMDSWLDGQANKLLNKTNSCWPEKDLGHPARISIRRIDGTFRRSQGLWDFKTNPWCRWPSVPLASDWIIHCLIAWSYRSLDCSINRSISYSRDLRSIAWEVARSIAWPIARTITRLIPRFLVSTRLRVGCFPFITGPLFNFTTPHNRWRSNKGAVRIQGKNDLR